MTTTAGTLQLPALASSVAPLRPVLTPKELIGAIRDLAIAVQGIRLYPVAPYGPQPVARPPYRDRPSWLPWQPPQLATTAVLAWPLQPTLQLPPPPSVGPLQPTLQLPPLPQTTFGPGPTSAWGVPIH
ncbi:hypothetical protein D1007_58296 [Hordeum vulgare]|nr:hypothetical protein D1007_58296 [Hordeum vulgare]